jgi:hypothetical protein
MTKHAVLAWRLNRRYRLISVVGSLGLGDCYRQERSFG